ncbi:MAG: hypothetical protein HZA53_18280 [Planctomycetes bacterium]|nr:hypothetical protein [Planctomycetota bacterium]
MTTSTHGGLKELESRMRELVLLLDGAQANVTTLERAWNACAEHAPELAEAARGAASAAGEERANLRLQLERLVQLNEAARQTVAREQSAIVTSLERVRGARAKLEHLEEAPVTGDSCDVSA